MFRVQISARRPANVTEFTWVSDILPGEWRDSTIKLGHDRFLPIHHSLITLSFDAIVLVTDQASLNKLQTKEMDNDEWNWEVMGR
jgi:hypothetical protein